MNRINVENIHQQLIELIADFLDSESVKLEELCGNFEDATPAEETELHVFMADAAIAVYKSRIQKTCFVEPNARRVNENLTKGDVLVNFNNDTNVITLIKFKSFLPNNRIKADLIYSSRFSTAANNSFWQTKLFQKAVSNIKKPSYRHVGRKAIVLLGAEKGRICKIVAVNPEKDAPYVVTYWGNGWDSIFSISALYLIRETSDNA